MIQNVTMTLLLLATAVQDPPAPAGTEQVQMQARPGLVPGELPANAAPDAAQAWKALCAAVGAGESGERLRAFDLTFEGTAYSGEAQSNDFDIERFLYLDPGWVRMTLKSGRVRLRGPAGDFLLDTKRGSQVPLRGKELAQVTASGRCR